MAQIPKSKIEIVRSLYVDKKLSMNEIANRLNVSIHAVTYCMRKNNIPRRTFTDSNHVLFEKKTASFTKRQSLSAAQEKLFLAGLILYWCEGYKSEKSAGIDFANSDPNMVALFCKFLRVIYRIDERRLRVLLYCYSDQDTEQLIDFWTNTTGIPRNQFTQPYVRSDFRPYGRKMQYGMVHIRYSDKKLFLSIMESVRAIRI